MKICIDLFWLRSGEMGGLENFVRLLLPAIKKIDSKNIYYLLVTTSNADSFKELESENFKIIDYNFDNSNRILRVQKEETAIKNFVIRENIDLVYFPTHNRTFFKLPCKTMSMVHDLRFLHYKEGFSALRLIYLRLLHCSIKKNSDYIIFNSDIGKKDFIEKIGNRGNLYTIYSPVKKTEIYKSDEEQNNVLKKYGIETKKYLYTVSSMMYHKNLLTLIKAINIIKKSIPDIKLVITGLNGEKTPEIKKLIKENDIEDNIILTGYISEEDKQILYNNANIFVFPSIFEGFGVPPVEAIYSKLPVIVSDIPIMKEILKNNFKIFYINKYMNPSSWSSRIMTILNGKREDYLPSNDFVKELEKRYSPETAAKAYLSLFKSKIEKKHYNNIEEIK